MTIKQKHNVTAVRRAMGRTLRVNRKRRGMTAERLALTAQVDRTFISQIERGIRQPTISIFISLSTALEMKPPELMSDVVKELKEVLADMKKNQELSSEEPPQAKVE